MIIKNGKYYDENFSLVTGDIKIDGDTIVAIGGNFGDDPSTIDANDLIVLPGLIDIHIHGCVGADTGDINGLSIQKMAKHLSNRGVTSFIPTAITESQERLEKIAKVIGELPLMNGCSRVVGWRMEGPYLSTQKPGAHNVNFMRKPDITETLHLNELSGYKLKIVDIAPEVEDAEKFIHQAVHKGFVVSIAHSNADYDTTIAAYKAGANDTTHLFNAMSPLNHREPGVVGAAFDTDSNSYAELITDGVHVHPTVVRTAIKLLGEDRLILISDGCAAMGVTDGEYMIGDIPIIVKNSIARTHEGALAGSTTSVFDCMIRCIKMGVSFKTALKAATINPAKLIGMDSEIGSIAVGKKADFVVIDNKGEIKRVIIGGKPVIRGLSR